MYVFSLSFYLSIYLFFFVVVVVVVANREGGRMGRGRYRGSYFIFNVINLLMSFAQACEYGRREMRECLIAS